jgi:hypothetical protein
MMMKKLKLWLGLIVLLMVAYPISRAIVLIYVYFPSADADCVWQGRIVSENGRGDRVEQAEEFCDGFLHSLTGTISILPASFGLRRAVLMYDLRGDEPKIFWQDDNNVIIEMSNDVYVYRRQEWSYGINVHFKEQIHSVMPDHTDF